MADPQDGAVTVDLDPIPAEAVPPEQVERKPEAAPVDQPERATDDDEDTPETELSPQQQARRERRRQARIREREERQRDREELGQLKALVSEIVPQFQQLRTAQVNNAVQGAQAAYQEARAGYQAAVETGDPAAITDANERLIEAKANFNWVQQQAQRAQQQPKPKPQGQTPRQAPAAVADFTSRHPWATEDNDDAAILRALDNRLASERRDVGSAEYMAELERRAMARLPDRFAPESRPRDGRAPVGGGAGRGPAQSAPNRVTIPAQLLANAKEAGLDIADPAVLKSLASQVRTINARRA